MKRGALDRPPESMLTAFVAGHVCVSLCGTAAAQRAQLPDRTGMLSLQRHRVQRREPARERAGAAAFWPRGGARSRACSRAACDFSAQPARASPRPRPGSESFFSSARRICLSASHVASSSLRGSHTRPLSCAWPLHGGPRTEESRGLCCGARQRGQGLARAELALCTVLS